MKGVIVSDTHGLEAILDQVLDQHKDADLFIHCGDSELSKDHPKLKDFKVVKGNVDLPNSGLPEEWYEEVGGIQWLVVHGHRDGVHHGLLNINYKAEERQADVICFGHTHMAGATTYNDRVFINPGSLNSPRDRIEKTYAVCEWSQTSSDFKVTFFTDQGEELSELSRTFSIT